MKKILLLILLMQTNAVYLLCFAQGVLSPNNRGMERVMRIEQSWDWGTYGHGSFDDAVRAFNAEKDVATYLVGASTFRVFTRFKKNYVEVNTGQVNGIYTYTTNTTLDAFTDKVPEPNRIKTPFVKQEPAVKILRSGNTWEWGTFDHGSFDEAVSVLHPDDVVSLKGVVDSRIKYRVFTNTTLNFIEVDYGWPGGVFCYTTLRME